MKRTVAIVAAVAFTISGVASCSTGTKSTTISSTSSMAAPSSASATTSSPNAETSWDAQAKAAYLAFEEWRAQVTKNITTAPTSNGKFEVIITEFCKVQKSTAENKLGEEYTLEVLYDLYWRVNDTWDGDLLSAAMQPSACPGAYTYPTQAG